MENHEVELTQIKKLAQKTLDNELLFNPEFLNKQGSLDGDTSRKASTVGDSKDIGGSRVNVDSTESSIDD